MNQPENTADKPVRHQTATQQRQVQAARLSPARRPQPGHSYTLDGGFTQLMLALLR